jgi:hypothetical protein
MANEERLANQAPFADAQQVDLANREGIEEIAQLVGEIKDAERPRLGR